MEFFSFDWISDPSIWLALVTLAGLEIVLGIDNLVFIAILTNRLPPERRPAARKVGMAMALVTRLMLLGALAWLVQLTQPILTVAGLELSWREVADALGKPSVPAAQMTVSRALVKLAREMSHDR